MLNPSTLVNYGMAKEYGGKFNLRVDDANPTKEKSEFVESIKTSWVQWLGADFEDRLFYMLPITFPAGCMMSAVRLIKEGEGWCSALTADEMREVHKAP